MSDFFPFVCCPTYDGRMSNGTHAALMRATLHMERQMQAYPNISLLAYNFNKGYATALNARKQGVTHFVMLHADVEPVTDDWIGQLLDDAASNELDVVSAIIPIKNESGDTSTAVQSGGNEFDRHAYKVGDAGVESCGVLHQYDKYWPKDDTLLINTGCMLMDIRKPWAERFSFSMRDGIGKDAEGNFVAWNHSEDWEMSRWLKRNGVPYGATANVKCIHHGGGAYKNWVEDATTHFDIPALRKAMAAGVSA